MGDHEACRILLLEDEPMILLDLEFAVEDAGCRPLTARNLDEAFAHLHASRPITVAVLDVSLGKGVTCEPVARELSEQGVPYILHSGDLDRADESVRRLGAELVPKPAPAAHVIQRALAGARGRTH